MIDKLWVVVADSARARIFSAASRTAPLIEIETLEHPEARMHAIELTSDQPGRDADRSGKGSHGINADNPKQHEAELFAREIAAMLEAGRNANKFMQLAIIASPSFLGMLRDLFSAPLTNMVSCEVSKNLTQLDVNVIRNNLPEQLSPMNA